LLQQGVDLRGGVHGVIGQADRDDAACGGIQAHMQLPPSPAVLGTMLRDKPFAGPVQLYTAAVHQQLQRFAGLWDHRDCHALGTPIGNRQVDRQQLDDGTHQPLGLAQR
jgi:hypothetical protein